jgi:hypothetical protein
MNDLKEWGRLREPESGVLQAHAVIANDGRLVVVP